MSTPDRTPRPRWFGRARRLTTAQRVREIAFDLLFRGAWPPRLARPLGLVGTLGVSTHDIALPAPPGDVPPPLRVAFVSDLHSGPGTHPALVAEACRAVAGAAADLVLLGGDFVGFHARHVDTLVPMLAAIRAPLGTYAVLGNHDLIADDRYIADRLAEAGVRVLVNESVVLAPPWNGISLIGLDDWNEGSPDADAAFANTPGVRLVLMHSPDVLEPIGDRDFAIAFCGHVHGGQFWFDGRSSNHPRGELSRRYQRGGVFRVGPHGDRILLVSRGIGQTTLPLRRRADPEVHVCMLAFARGAADGARQLASTEGER